MRISEDQFASLQTFSRERFETELADWLRVNRAAYVDDLTPSQLNRVAKAVCARCDALELFGEDATRAFGSAATVYGVYSETDPLFEDIYYATLPRAGARIPHKAAGIWDGLVKVLDAEFSTRSGIELMNSLEQAFCGDSYPDLPAMEVLQTYFPERFARLTPSQIKAHLAHSDYQAKRLELEQPMALRFHRDVGLLLGAYFSIDPLYPWAQKAFAHAGDDMAKISRLRAALTHIVRQTQTPSAGEPSCA